MRTRHAVALMAVSMMLPLLAGAQDGAPAVPEAPAVQEVSSEAAADAYGLSREHAIEVCYPDGEQQYLARLVCADNSHPAFERSGSVGPRQPMPAEMSEQMMKSLFDDMREPRKREPGEPDYHIVDAYDVVCGEVGTTLYLDMYHCAQERPTAAPKGFTIID
jgi:hypothetical protein